MTLKLGKTYRAKDGTLVEIYAHTKAMTAYKGKFLHGVPKLVRLYSRNGMALDIYGAAIGEDHQDNIVEEYHEVQNQAPAAPAEAGVPGV